LVLCLGLINGQLANLFTTKQTGQGTYYGTTSQGTCSILSPRPAFANGMKTVAMNQPQFSGGDVSMSCGMCVQVTGTGKGSGSNPITGTFLAVVADLCPECKTGDLDLAVSGDGRWNINWVAVDCPVQGNLQYSFSEKNSYYIKMQVRNHRIPVKAVQFQGKDGKWYKGSRTIDNYFEAPSYPYPVAFPLQVQIQGLNGAWVTDKVGSQSTSVINGLLKVQLGSIKAAAKAVAGPDTQFTPSDTPNSAPNLDPAVVAVIIGASILLLVAVVGGIGLLARSKRNQMETESKP